MTKPATDPMAAARARLRRASWIAGGMSLLALIAAAWVALSASPRLESPALPRPNGFDDALRAAKVIEQAKFPNSQILDVTTASADALRPWVEMSRQAVETLREAIRQPFQVPVTYDMDVMMKQASEQAPIRSFAARALHAKGRLDHLEGRNDEAARAFLDLLRLGNAMGRNVPMVVYSASQAPASLGLIGLHEIRGSLNAEELERAITELQDLDAESVPTSEPIRLEHAFMELNVRARMGVGGVFYRAMGHLNRDKATAASTLTLIGNSRSAARRLILADLALRLHRLRNGNDPESLDALVPTILKVVPTDPYTGKPLIYRKNAAGHELYAAGPDGDDDRLDPPLGKRHLQTSNGDFTVDSF